MNSQIEVVSPNTLNELGEALGKAGQAGQVVIASGGSSKAHWGGPVEHVQMAIDTTGLTDVDHAKEDQTVIVGAGKNFAELQGELARSGQRISLDPANPDARATIGGVVATADAGPLRFRYGSPRELIIGARLGLMDGTVAHSGGKVIKNVAGFDLAKLIVGSFGTLGVIGEVAFRLHPLPETQMTVTVQLDAQSASKLTTKVLASVVEPNAIEYTQGMLVFLVEGTLNGAKAQVEKLVSLIKGEAPGTNVEVFETKSDASIWSRLDQERSSAGQLNARIVTRVSHLAEIHEAAARLSGKVEIKVISHAGSGVHDLVVSGEGNPGEVREALTRFRDEIRHLPQPLTVRSAAPGFEDLVDLLGTPAPMAVSVMQKVKASLDPDRLLAPGRFRPWW